MGKFEETFCEPVDFSDGSVVIDGMLSRQEAADAFSVHIGDMVWPQDIRVARVRFGFPPEYIEGANDMGACWFCVVGTGKGTRAVWIIG